MEKDAYNIEHDKIILTKEQESCLNYKGEKTLLVKGIAGAGKSVVIQNLARKLLTGISKSDVNAIAIFTFNNTLNAYTKELIGEEGVTITTLDAYISQIYNAMGGPKLKIYSKQERKEEIMRLALKKHKETCGPHRFQNLDPKFWIEEIEWMKEMDVSTKDMTYYIEIQIKGRGGKVRMSAADRIVAFQIYMKYESEMQKKGMGDWIDYALYLTHHIDEIPDQYKFKHVLIDEAQDLPLVKMKAAMSLTGKDMVIAMDMNQRIYQKYWTPRMLGIETTTKKLTKSMRTTKQIDALAESLRRHNDEFLNEDDKSFHAIPEREGDMPFLAHLDDLNAEKKFVIKRIKTLLKINPNVSIGVIAAKNSQIKTYSAWMTDAGIMHETLQKDSKFSVRQPGVKIVNVFNAKGLEFTHVIIPQFIEGKFPYYFSSTDDEEVQNFLIKSRNLVYVAMTRAKKTLLITYSGDKGSRFIGELDEELYKAVGDIIYVKSNVHTSNRVAEKSKLDYESLILPPVVRKEKPSADGKSLKEYLQDKGLEVIDKRVAGGALWIVGDKEKLTPVIKEIATIYGAYGNFSAGGRATRQRPGWFTQCKK